MYGTMLFYPVSILVASQLLGIRAALYWFLINLCAFTAFFITVHGFDQATTSSRLDELVLLLGVAACVYFCCQQGEEYYRKRTGSLIRLSQDLEQKSQRLQVLATTDALTGLTNRFQFQERLQETVNQAVETSTRMALFLVDMDGFKEINDTHGHPVGDEALIAIADRLVKEFGGRSEVSRLGGDEFCIITTNLHDDDEAEEIARRVCQELTHRYRLGDDEFPMGASVGYCICPDHAVTDKDVLAYADTAMFHAKEHRLGHARYEREMTDRLVEYRTVQEKLSLALERNEFFLVYQPQVNIDSKQVIGVEALLRWRSDGEIVPPIRFIHLLERSREILPVSNWIIRQACRQLAIWDAGGFRVKISVNVSPLQFNDPNFFQCVTNSVTEFGVDPSLLDFEITEGLLIDDVAMAAAKLQQLKDMGASISVDDFGTGYSSLSYLRQFPIDRLKIDRAFIKDIPDNDDGVIASSIIVLAKSLRLEVLAEGVETEEQLQFLKAQDCDEYQGYFFSRPVSADEVSVFFKAADPKPSGPVAPIKNDRLNGLTGKCTCDRKC
jgi:diguanylate cyclase (GGDEF)-like protein